MVHFFLLVLVFLCVRAHPRIGHCDIIGTDEKEACITSDYCSWTILYDGTGKCVDFTTCDELGDGAPVEIPADVTKPIEIKEINSTHSEIAIPKTLSKVVITLPNTAEKTYIINDVGPAQPFTGELEINAGSGSPRLIINISEAAVTVRGIFSTTTDWLGVGALKIIAVREVNVASDSNIDIAYLADGNVDATRIQSLGLAALPAGVKIFWEAETADQLRHVLSHHAGANHGVVLKSSVGVPAAAAMTGTGASIQAFYLIGYGIAGSAFGDGYLFDGNGMTITAAAYANVDHVLIVYASDVIIQNLYIDVDSQNMHGLTIWRSSDVVLAGVSVKKALRNGVYSRGSNVTAQYLTVFDNGWGGVGVDNENPTNKNVFILRSTLHVGDNPALFTESESAVNTTVLLPPGWTGVPKPVYGCIDNQYTTETQCTTGGSSWGYTGVCSDNTLTTFAACTAPMGVWTPEGCSNPLYVESGICTSNGGTWTAESCSDSALNTKATCVAPKAVWTWTGTCNISIPEVITEAACKNAGGDWTWNTVPNVYIYSPPSPGSIVTPPPPGSTVIPPRTPFVGVPAHDTPCESAHYRGKRLCRYIQSRGQCVVEKPLPWIAAFHWVVDLLKE